MKRYTWLLFVAAGCAAAAAVPPLMPYSDTEARPAVEGRIKNPLDFTPRAFATDPAPPAPAPTPAPTPAPLPSAVSVTMPSAVNARAGHYARVPISYIGEDFKWWTDSLDALDVWREYDPRPNAVVLRVGPETGTYHLHAIAAAIVNGKATMSVPSDCVITIGAPVPPGPTPPGPNPPTPPTPPSPPPSPAPIPGEGLHVLMLYDSNQNLPAKQESVMLGIPMQTYMNSVTPMGADGKTHEWRIWDKDTDPSGDEPCWTEAMKLPHATMPWIVVSNSKVGGFQGPLPADYDTTKALIAKYAVK